jgi:predicted GIY-YIG superfamily endonuclease
MAKRTTVKGKPRKRGDVYLLHFSEPVSPNHTCQHYLGFTSDLDTRLAEHEQGKGARLTEVAASRGITWTVARVWRNKDRNFERRLKNRKNAPRLCPCCQCREVDAA